MFTPDEIGAQLAQIERSQNELMFWRRMIFSVRVRPQSRSAFSSSCWSRNC